MAYIPNTDADREAMLATLGLKTVDALFADIPKSARPVRPPEVPGPLAEWQIAQVMGAQAGRNRNTQEAASFLGAGIYDHHIPTAVWDLVNRGEFKTAYTPYQPEVSQGFLQTIYEYQSMICALTEMDISNASLYDGAGAAVEAMLMAVKRTKRPVVAASEALHPDTRAVLETYARMLDLRYVLVPHAKGITDLNAVDELVTEDVACLITQAPNFFGIIEGTDGELGERAHRHGAKWIVSCDPVSLGLLHGPGAYGADIAVGEGQGLGIPQALGGATFGFLAIKNEGLARRERMLKFMPGRLCGSTLDARGEEAYALSLTTREQHVKRERATSNICTNQALLALAATVHLSLLGSAGLREVAHQCLQKAHYAAKKLTRTPGVNLAFPKQPFFKEFALKLPGDPAKLNRALKKVNIIGGYPLEAHYPALENGVLLAVTEKRSRTEIDALAAEVATWSR